MANRNHVATLKRSVQAWNQWRAENPEIIPNLCDAGLVMAHLVGANLDQATLIGAELSGADLRIASLRYSDLRRADLREADLRGANVSGADLREADLRCTYFRTANLRSSNLEEADLRGADLTGANLSDARLHKTNLYEAQTAGTIFGDSDLTTAKGLDSVSHRGPSTIGIDTIYRSQGMILDPFLRGAGVPDEFISYARSLTANPIEFNSCFISYSSEDQEFAEHLSLGLQNKGVRCWFAPHDARGGRKVHEQIDQAIRVHDRLLLILSGNSMRSEWVKTEIAKARKRELQENRTMLFPLRLVSFDTLRDWECFDADTGKDSAREIREYFIPDFSNWKNHDSYKKQFEELLHALRAHDLKT